MNNQGEVRTASAPSSNVKVSLETVSQEDFKNSTGSDDNYPTQVDAPVVDNGPPIEPGEPTSGLVTERPFRDREMRFCLRAQVQHKHWTSSSESFQAGGSDYYIATIRSVEDVGDSGEEGRQTLWIGREMILRAAEPVASVENALKAARGEVCLEGHLREETLPDGGGMVQTLVISNVK
jgi:hypothetical protein